MDVKRIIQIAQSIKNGCYINLSATFFVIKQLKKNDIIIVMNKMTCKILQYQRVPHIKYLRILFKIKQLFTAVLLLFVLRPQCATQGYCVVHVAFATPVSDTIEDYSTSQYYTYCKHAHTDIGRNLCGLVHIGAHLIYHH